MRAPIAYGIDFGTTNSAIAVAYDDGTTSVVGAPDPVTPSLVYLHRNANRLSGPEAIRAYLLTGAMETRCRGCSLASWDGGVPASTCQQVSMDGHCQDARLLSQLKGDLTADTFQSTHSWGVDFELEDLVAIVLRRLKSAADQATGHDVKRVVLGHPVRFAGAEGARFVELQKLALARLARAAERAGFVEGVSLVEESKAAIALEGVSDGLLVCTDFGGGTFDMAVAEVSGTTTTILDLAGVSIGGEEFNSKIFDTFVRPRLGLDEEFVMWDGQTRTLPALLRSQLRSLSGLKSLLVSNVALDASAHYRGRGHDAVLDFVDELLYNGQAFQFFGAIESAKIELSSVQHCNISFRSVGLTLDIPVTRAEFEEAIAGDMRSVRLCMQDSLDDAGVSADEVGFVTQTGGSSQLPVFQRMLRELFPDATVVQSDPFTSVVTGLANYALEEWVDD